MKARIAAIINAHRQLLGQFEAECIEALEASARVIVECIKKGGCVYICGNGGSAADAQHIAGELVGRFQRDRRAFAAVALTTDTSVITAIGNDFSFDEIFARQVSALAGPDDVLWALSTSGRSPNILSAVATAKLSKAKVIAFTGRKNTPLERNSDVCMAVDAPTTAAAQQIHQLAYHIICALAEQQLCLEE